MSKNVKIIIAIAVIAVLAAGIGIPLAIWGDDLGAGVSAVLSNQNIYTLAQVQEAQQAAQDELAAEKERAKVIIAEYEQKLKEKEETWQAKYDAMVAEKNAEIASLRTMLEESRGYGNAMENYLLGTFSLLYDSFDSPKLNNYLLEAFTQMQIDTNNALIDYNKKLGELPQNLQAVAERHSQIIRELSLLQIELSQNNNYLDELYAKKFLISPMSYVETISSTNIYFRPNGISSNQVWLGYLLFNSTTSNVKDIQITTNNANTDVFYDFLHNNVTYPFDPIYDSSMIEWFFLMAYSKYKQSPIFYEKNNIVYDFEVFSDEVDTAYQKYLGITDTINLLNEELAVIETVLNGEDGKSGTNDDALFLKGYYTSLKTQAEGALAEINKKIEKLISEGAILNE